MKTIHLTCVALFCAALMGCGSLQTDTTQAQKKETSTFGQILSAMTNADALGNAFNSVIGLDKPTEAQLYGSWHYTQPGVAFTSKNALAKAGGEVAATQAKEKLKAPYQSVGFNARNTALQLNKDKTFTIQLAGKTFQGSYTYHPDECKLDLQTFLITFPCYVKRTPKGMSFLLESKKLLTLFQAIASISGNSKLETIGKISKNYDGIRMGFEMGKQIDQGDSKSIMESNLILYTNDNGDVSIQVRYEDGTFWLTQKRMAELFNVSVSTINEHLKSIFNTGELTEEATIRKFRIVRNEGTRQG